MERGSYLASSCECEYVLLGGEQLLNVHARTGGGCFGRRVWERLSLRLAIRGEDAFSGHQELWESSDGINGGTELLRRLHGESSAHETRVDGHVRL